MRSFEVFAANPRRLLLATALASAARVANAQVDPHGPGPQSAASSGTSSVDAPGTPEHAIVTTASAELAGYTDTDSVTVITPSVAATVRDDLRGWSANGSYLADIVSAASVDIVSTASQRWTEVRHAGDLGATYMPRSTGVAVDASASSEPDYVSFAAGGRLLLELANKTVNPTFGYAFAHDTAGKTGTPFSVYSQQLARHDLSAGLELVLDGATTFSLTGDALLERGDQKKPYRMLPVFKADAVSKVPAGASLALVNQTRQPGNMMESTPLERNRFALAGRLARRFSGCTLVLSERLYADDWGLLASTTEARFVLDAGRRLLVWLYLRGHVQNGVSFWQRAYVGDVTSGNADVPKYRTGDRELSPLVAGTAGAGVRWNFGRRSNPSSWGLVLQDDLVATHFENALYVTDRIGELAILQLEVEL